MLTSSGQPSWSFRTGPGSPWLIHTGRGPAYWRRTAPINSAIRGCHTVTEGWVLYSALAASPVWLPRLAGWPWEPLAAHPRLSRGLSHGARSIVRLFLSGELLLGKLGETVVVVGNAPQDRPAVLVRHLIGNRASFLCTKPPMPRVPKSNFLDGHCQDP
jgi:hypothetical protein